MATAKVVKPIVAPDPKLDVVIIGAGLAGLACARDLVAAGLRVLVLESSDAPGGRIMGRHAVRQRHDGRDDRGRRSGAAVGRRRAGPALDRGPSQRIRKTGTMAAVIHFPLAA